MSPFNVSIGLENRKDVKMHVFQLGRMDMLPPDMLKKIALLIGYKIKCNEYRMCFYSSEQKQQLDSEVTDLSVDLK